ncbi:STAS domain-containing protein [Formosa haliotis]|uniref:STAS domain-containing protein n=1 Tax=Formosa haliotis TaxID=1555194 RepID=UPI000824698E|nr:STAS domain-containing protein [Formosa haliotis]
MALEILQNNEAFVIDGDLNHTNVSKFHASFENAFTDTNQLVINIDKLKSADVAGVSAFESLYQQAVKHKKRLVLVGYGSRDLYNHFETTFTRN